MVHFYLQSFLKSVLHSRQVCDAPFHSGAPIAFLVHPSVHRAHWLKSTALDNSEKSCLIYQVLCHDWSFLHIGQTKHDLKSRLNEHERAIKNHCPNLSVLHEHSITTNHIISPGQKLKFWN